MSSANLVMGCWKPSEWPEYVIVCHEGMREPWRRYVPERTCRMDPVRSGFLEDVWRCSACLAEFAKYRPDVKKASDFGIFYCPKCGAKVVGE